MAGWGQVMEAPECQVSIGNYVWCIHIFYEEHGIIVLCFMVMKSLLIHQILIYRAPTVQV